MTIKLASVFSVTLSIFLISSIFFHFSAALGGAVGGWTPINDVNAPDVVEIGQFAVNEHNKEAGTKLEFQSIAKGESQVVAGTNYRLVINAKDGGGSIRRYLAIVWDKPWEKFKKLTSFKEIASEPPVVLQRLSSPIPAVAASSFRENSFGAGDGAKMKGLFKSKPKTPVDLVRQTRELLMYVDRVPDTREGKREEKMMELSKSIRELKIVLYGNGESEPLAEACAQLTQEFFRENTLRLIINCLPNLNLETRKDATQVVANLQRQQVQSRLIACDYLEANIDLMDKLILGYENTDMALHYGAMLRECIRHQSVARYVLESEHMKKFFDYIQLPNFDIAADAAATFKELLTRHKSTVAEFLSKNYDWFFTEYNSKLLESSNYITRRQAVKLLADMLLDRSNSAVMTRYVSSRENLRILMNLLRESSKSIQIEAFHVFKLFAANHNKPPDIVSILVANRSKLLRLFADFKTEKEDEQFEADKAQVVKEIAALEPKENK
ncbi:hypothetical protein HAX54_029976 [Datura stramonium]|uniref:Cystatin domain-containing protein n=2 Tax=Datura stramonium TaxID=4076 RepID=A0ABS8SAK1_DATST|nr:hypothetical protein [Datura stramonium]